MLQITDTAVLCERFDTFEENTMPFMRTMLINKDTWTLEGDVLELDVVKLLQNAKRL